MSNIVKHTSEQIEKVVAGMSQQEKDICGALNTFNQLRSFKLDIVEILEWKDTIVKLLPRLEVPALEFAIEKMILGELEYQHNDGIQNIIRALKKIEKTETGFRIITNQKQTW